VVGCSIHSDRWWICGGVCRSTCRSTGSIRLWVIWDRQPAVPRCWLTAERHCRPPTVWQQWAAVSATAVSTWRHSATPAGWSSALPNTSSTVIRTVITRVYLALALALSISIAQTPTVRPRAHYIVIISCYSEQYARLKRNVFSRQRKAAVDCVLFSFTARRNCLTLASYRRCCQHDQRPLLSTGFDGRTLLSTVDNTCDVMTVEVSWQQLWCDAKSNSRPYSHLNVFCHWNQTISPLFMAGKHLNVATETVMPTS